MSKFIAEISSNHSTDFDRCIDFIDSAAKIGCYAVKFQLFEINQLFCNEVLELSKDHRRRKKWELPKEFIPELSNYSKKQNLKFSCTPFFLDAVDFLEPYVDFFKIASYELLWNDLIRKCASTKKPLIISTGMADMDEIDNAVSVSRNSGCKDLSILQCVSHYPASYEDVNLRVIKTFRDRYKCKVGWSDHTVNENVIRRAKEKWNADYIEFHLDLDGNGEEYSTGHCWLPEKINHLITEKNFLDENSEYDLVIDGDGIKMPCKSEKKERNWRADPEDGLRPLKNIRNKVENYL